MKKRILSIILVLALCLTLMPMTAFAADDFTITNGTPVSDKETNHGYISIDKSSASEGDTVTVTVNPNEGYQLKSLTVVPAVLTFKAVYNTAGGANILTFYYDAVDHSGNGKTVYDNLPTAATQATDWGYNANRSNIKSVEIDSSVANYHGLTSTAYMFYNMKNANGISGADNLDVSNVTDMSYMFNECSVLESLDVSNFDMSKVTDMSNMFSACKKLQSLSLYGNEYFVVTDMSNMFASCESLTELEFTDFDTSNVTNMANMFQNCKKLQSLALDLNGFDTKKVTDMGHMFENCECLYSLDISTFDTSNVTKMNDMFSGCSILTDLDLSEFTIGDNADVTDMFSDCLCLARVGIKNEYDDIEQQLETILNEDWLYIEQASAYIAPGTITVGEILPADFPTYESDENTWWKDNAEEYKVMFKMEYDSLRVGKADKNFGKDIASNYVLKKDGNSYKGGYEGYKWIFNMESETLKSVVLEGPGLMAGTYAPATTIETVADVLATNPDFPKAEANAWTNKNGKKCYLNGESLVVAGTPYPISSSVAIYEENDYESSTEDGLELTFNMINGVLTSIDVYGFENDVNGIYVPKDTAFKAVYNTAGGANILTFYYDAVDHSGNGKTVYEGSTGEYYLFDSTKSNYDLWGYNQGNNGIVANIKSVIIDESVKNYHGLTSTSFMFQSMKNATSISGAEYLDVANVTDMSYMFQNFGNALTDFNAIPNVSGWNTGKVTNVNYMFQKYASASTVLNVVPDVSGWNTGKVTNMLHMFSGYGFASTVLNAVPDVSGWKTENVTDMSNMFKEYGNKSTVLNVVPDVSGWNTGNVTSMANMFNKYGYSSPALTKVPDVSGWSTAKLTNLGNMFQDYGGLNTSGATTVESNVEFTLDLSGWDLTNLTSGGSLFTLKPKTFKVTIPANTGEKDNETGKWYYGNGTKFIEPATGKQFTLAGATINTLGDLMTLQGNFPDSEDTGWVCGNNKMWYCYVSTISLGTLYVHDSEHTQYGLAFDNSELTKVEGGYKYESSSSTTLIFHMDGDTISSIECQCSEDYYTGNYAPASNPLTGPSPKSLTGPSPDPEITPAKQADGTYTFTMPGYPVTVTAEFEEAHTHAFTYTANNGKITATCVDGCDGGYGTNPLTLTLTAPTSLVYDRNAKAFTFAYGEAAAWETAGLELPTIYYHIKQSGQTGYMPLLGTLKDAGSYMAQITVDGKNAQVEFAIDKATPYIKTTPAPNDIEYGKKLSDSTLFGGDVQISSTISTQVGGLFAWTNPDTVPGIDDSEITEYDVTFTPADTNNYNTVSCKITIKVTHTHNLIKVTGQAATKEAAGWKDYYKCDCGALFEDENGTTPIENLDAWKAVGGNGYIQPLAPEIYTVTFNMNGHGTQIDPQTVEEGNKATKPSDPTAEGWTFGGWYADATFSVAFDFDSDIDANTTIYAKWTKNTPAPSGDSTPIVTVPVTGDENSVKVSATVSGSTATIKDIKDADLAKVTGGESVEIDLTDLKKDIDTAKIPTATVEKIGEQAGMSVKLTTATVSFDKTATQEISDQAKGNTVELVVDGIKEVSLNAVQKEAVQKLDTALIIDAYLVSNGTKLCTENRGGFNGGKATVMLPYEIKNNRSASNYNVYYVDDAGKLEKLAAKYDTKLGAFVFDIEHFSNYVVAYDENACPQDETCVYAKFTDADTKAWYHDGVHFCVENGYMQGVSADKFAPNGTLSRGMIVTMLWRMEGEPVVNYAMSFKDVKADQWYTEAIRWAQSTGVVDGYSADSFGPDDNVTREQLAAILYNYAKIKGQGFTGDWMFLLDFVDRSYISSWADEAVHWCSMKGIVNGKDGKVFDPQGNATRAEAASMVQRFCEAVTVEK